MREIIKTENSTYLRIATFNLYFSMNKNALVKSLVAMAKDGVQAFCLQEVVGNEKEKDFILNEVISILGKEWKVACHLGGGTERKDFGTCILWNSQVMEMVEVEKLFLPKIEALQFHEYVFEKLVGGEGQIITRRGISGIFRFGEKKLLITSVHLEHVGGIKQRNKQLQFLLDHAKKKEIPNMIFAGDFNSFDLLKRGKERQSLYRLFGSLFKDASEQIDWTADLNRTEIPNRFPYFVMLIKLLRIHIRRKLDYIWVKNFKVISCKKIELEGSDHFPITAELSLV